GRDEGAAGERQQDRHQQEEHFGHRVTTVPSSDRGWRNARCRVLRALLGGSPMGGRSHLSLEDGNGSGYGPPMVKGRQRWSVFEVLHPASPVLQGRVDALAAAVRVRCRPVETAAPTVESWLPRNISP